MAHTPGPWIWSAFCKPSGEPIVSVEDIAETMAGSARHSERTELFGVSLDDASQHPDGLATVVCYTGNGPNAHNNARAIAAMMTQGVALLRRLVEERDHGFVYSADRLAATALLDYLDGREQPATVASSVIERDAVEGCMADEVVEELTVGDMDKLRHMLGVNEKTPRGYRNHYVAGGDDVASMERMRRVGLVVKNERVSPELTGGNPCYHATINGAQFIGLRVLPR